MKILRFLLISIFLWGCDKSEKDFTCGASSELNTDFDGGFVAMANVFTPDGDGVDEAFGPISYGLSSFNLVIKDNDGETVFETADQSKWWDGRVGGAVKSGTYSYNFEATTVKGEHLTKSGHVCVITGANDFCYENFNNFRFTSLYNNGSFASPEVYREKYNKCD